MIRKALNSLMFTRLGRKVASRLALGPSLFLKEHYRRNNSRRLEHLASLRLPIAGRRVLELGAGIGDHTDFFLDRGCTVVTSDARPENVAALTARFPDLRVMTLDLDSPPRALGETWDVVYAYGVLYHLRRPEAALRFMSDVCSGLLLLETCVSFGDDDRLEACAEDAGDATQASSGFGCRPTRAWVQKRLKALFPCVYVPRTQPAHEEFPTDWTAPSGAKFSRSVFVASRSPLENDLLCEDLPARQARS